MLVLVKAAPFLIPPLLLVETISGSLVLVVAVFLILVGLLHRRRTARRRRALLQRRNGRYVTPAELRGSLSMSRRFAQILIGVGVALTVLDLLMPSPLISAVVGVVVTAVIYAAGHQMQLDGIGVKLTCTLAMVAIAGFAYTSIVVAKVVSEIRRQGHTQEPPSQPEPKPHKKPKQKPKSKSEGEDDNEGSPPPSSERTYEENCPKLRDPRVIAHGLGDLFWEVGEPNAGCAEPAEAVGAGGSVWISQGICVDDLRSLAVVGEGRPAVLLFGEPARFALEAARAGRLLYAEVAEGGGGDIDVVATTEGNFVFARSSQVEERGDGSPRDCTEVTEIAAAFVRMPPPIAELWRRQMVLTGWAWPTKNEVSSAETLAFLDHDTGVVVATGGCEGDTLCHLDGQREAVILGGPTFVSIADLEPFLKELDE